MTMPTSSSSPASSTSVQQTYAPHDGSVVVERPLATASHVDAVLERAVRAGRDWAKTPLQERQKLCLGFVDAFLGMSEPMARELALQMGRPVAQASGEFAGTADRARTMVELAPQALADLAIDPVATGESAQNASPSPLRRWIRREPLGVVLTIAAWNYPYLIAVNSVVPALLAGNSVILKHSAQTPLCAERFAQAFATAGLPEGVFQVLHMSHEQTAATVADPRVGYVAFTGSVGGGHAVQRAGSERFVDIGLELGGKDPAYVRADADLAFTIEQLMDGAFYNSGQSCCGIERIYVHKDRYTDFVDGLVDRTSTSYQLGDPLDAATNLGPMVRPAAASFVREQIAAALAAGAEALIDQSAFAASQNGTAYLAPQVLVGVNHEMSVMREESFGPVVGVMPVASDEQAVALMNDSAFGLTASVWTNDAEAAVRLGEQVVTGTWFMNRCDYLDPNLAWVGVKDSGRGCTLSAVGFEHLTRPKSFHLRSNRGA